jgi:hypothetical protein
MNPNESEISTADFIPSASLTARFQRTLAIEAAAAVAALWDSKRKCFWRSTEHRAAESSQKKKRGEFFPTVTFRSLEALLRLIEERPEWADSSIIELAVTEAIPALLEYDETMFQSTLGISSEKNILNPFTLSLYVDCLARVSGCEKIATSQRIAALRRLESACKELLRYRRRQKVTQVGVAVHPFLIFHQMRAVEAAVTRLSNGITKSRLVSFRDHLADVLRQQVKTLLSQHNLGVMNPGEGVAVAFCAAALSGSREPENVLFVKAALRVAFDFQDASGCWPLGRIVRENQDSELKRDLQIPTYEISWALAEAVLGLFELKGNSPQDRSTTVGLERLARSITYTASSAVQLESGMKPGRGWCSDHAFGKPVIESWTSATVLQYILNFRKLSQSVDRFVVLGGFGTVLISKAAHVLG